MVGEPHLGASPDALLMISAGRIVWVSDHAATMLGTTMKALEGRMLADVLREGDAARLEHIESRRTQGWAHPAPYRVTFIRVSDGLDVPVEVRSRSVDAVEGRGPALMLAARDITEITRAERLMGELAQLSARGGAAFDAGALLTASSSLFEALGWCVAFTEVYEGESVTIQVLAAPDNPVGHYGRLIVGIRLPFARTPVLAEVVRTGRPIFLDHLPTDGSGPERRATALGDSMALAQFLQSAWCPVLTDGRLTHLLAVTGRNLTEHDFATLQLFAAQLGAANRAAQLRAELVKQERLAAVGEMAAVLAHEVRNPVGIIFNALTALRKSEPASGELLGIVHEEAERLRRLVSDLLDFSRPSAPEMQTVDVRFLIEQAADAVHHEGGAVVIAAPADLRARTDPHLLRRILINLLLNAHQSKAAHVGITAEAVDELELRIRVTNDGPSIASDDASRIFEPFFTTKATGTGLGLAVVRRLLDDLGGRITLDDTRDGVSFSVWLTRAAP